MFKGLTDALARPRAGTPDSDALRRKAAAAGGGSQPSLGVGSSGSPVSPAPSPTPQRRPSTAALGSGGGSTGTTAWAPDAASIARFEEPEARARLQLGVKERVVLVFSKTYHSGPKADQCGDLVFTTCHVLFVAMVGGQSVLKLKLPLAVLERVRGAVLTSNSGGSGSGSGHGGGNGTRDVPDSHTLLLELVCKYFRIIYFAVEVPSAGHAAAVGAVTRCCFPGNMANTPALHATSTAAAAAVSSWFVYQPQREYSRQGILNPNSHWRTTTINADYSTCPTYPAVLVVPKNEALDDDRLRRAATFRTRGRLPVLSYKHYNHASLCRSAQPMVGVTNAKSDEDQLLLQAVRDANPNGGVLHIVDARPHANALANTVMKGAGFEGSNYSDCQLEFAGIPNIHVVRESLRRFRSVCSQPDDHRFWSKVDDSQWLDYLRMVMTAAVSVAEKIHAGSSVLVHCSDGWDRTAQLTALAMLMLDPYYRTLEGFAVLVEKEWCSFGHKFGERCGHMENGEVAGDRSPIFLQWMECVVFLLRQFPCVFEFNERLLVWLMDRVWGCEYGNFLFDCERDRQENNIFTTTLSWWSYVSTYRSTFTNVLWNGHDDVRRDVLLPSLAPARFCVWSEYHMRHSSSFLPRHIGKDNTKVWAADARSTQLLNALAARNNNSSNNNNDSSNNNSSSSVKHIVKNSSNNNNNSSSSSSGSNSGGGGSGAMAAVVAECAAPPSPSSSSSSSLSDLLIDTAAIAAEIVVAEAGPVVITAGSGGGGGGASGASSNDTNTDNTTASDNSNNGGGGSDGNSNSDSSNNNNNNTDGNNNSGSSSSHNTSDQVMAVRYAIQQYAWGKMGAASAVAKLSAAATAITAIDAATPYAELWVGTHPSAPSTVVDDTKESQSLQQWLAAGGPARQGAEFGERWGQAGNLPFLLKVLSIAKPLSVQAHPDKRLAEQLHASRPDVYRDPNHKPELAIALTPFLALCCFRPVAHILVFVDNEPEFAAALGGEVVTSLRAAAAEQQQQQQQPHDDSFNPYLPLSAAAPMPPASRSPALTNALGSLLRALLSLPQDEVNTHTRALATRVAAMEKRSALHELVHSTCGHFPDDVGVFALMFLNVVSMMPGESIFLAANEPHAYLQGDCIECMACSDNVVRAGLTPKLKDVDTLCNMLTYVAGPPAVLTPRSLDVHTRRYAPPIDDFFVDWVTLPAAATDYTLAAHAAPSLLLVVSGAVDVVAPTAVSLGLGSAAVVVAGAAPVLRCRSDCAEPTLVVRASCAVQSAAAAAAAPSAVKQQ